MDRWLKTKKSLFGFFCGVLYLTNLNTRSDMELKKLWKPRSTPAVTKYLTESDGEIRPIYHFTITSLPDIH